MGLLASLFAPKIAELERDLAISEAKREFWEERFREERALSLSLQEQLATETQANRMREDLLLNVALRNAGDDGIPTKAALVSSDTTSDEDLKAQAEFDLQVLTDRAREIAVAKYGEDVADDQVERILAEIKKNPQYWLSN